MFSRRAASFDAVRISEDAWSAGEFDYVKQLELGGFAYGPAYQNPSFGGEIHHQRVIFTHGEGQGPNKTPLYWNTPEMRFPNHTRYEGWARDFRTVDASNYNHYHNFFSTEPDLAAYQSFDTKFKGSHSMDMAATFDMMFHVPGWVDTANEIQDNVFAMPIMKMKTVSKYFYFASVFFLCVCVSSLDLLFLVVVSMVCSAY